MIRVIVPRAVVVVESMTALTLVDLLLPECLPGWMGLRNFTEIGNTKKPAQPFSSGHAGFLFFLLPLNYRINPAS